MTLRSLVERLLPWYDTVRERLRDQRTERISQRSEDARARATRAIADFRRADAQHRRAGEDLIDEVEDG